ncbi:MAG TPA: nuclear transport factor 2 family protein [Candidatus Angelobacter sp.]|nr:nuclear transport factor 2 family protein [Candidatus Angelobacter sp.]
MRKTLAVCTLALFALIGVVQAKDKMTGGGTEKAIAGLEQTWVDGSKAGNADMVAPLLAEKLLNTNAEGKTLSKAETLANIKKATWQTNEISDVKVAVFGNTAIATGNWIGKGTVENGKAIDTQERWTDTWMKMPDGKWQCIASHSSTTKM